MRITTNYFSVSLTTEINNLKHIFDAPVTVETDSPFVTSGLLQFSTFDS